MPAGGFLGEYALSKYGLEAFAALGALLSLVPRKLKPIPAIVSFFGGFVIAAVFGPPAFEVVQATYKLSPTWQYPTGFLLGAVGWSAFGGVILLFDRFRANPTGFIQSMIRGGK